MRGPRGMIRNTTPDEHRINERIHVPEVRLISETGEQLGVLQTFQAQKLAEERGLDLVEVAPTAKPPVFRLMDYGKFKYKEQKKQAEARKKQTEVLTKELRVRYITDAGDLDVKLRKAREMLEEGNKVKFSMRFKGREVAYVGIGIQKFKEIEEALKDIAIIDESSNAGKQIYIVLAPAKKA